MESDLLIIPVFWLSPLIATWVIWILSGTNDRLQKKVLKKPVFIR